MKRSKYSDDNALARVFVKTFEQAAAEFIGEYTRHLNRAIELGVPMSSSEGYHRKQIAGLEGAFHQIAHAQMHCTALVDDTEKAMDRLRTTPISGQTGPSDITGMHL